MAARGNGCCISPFMAATKKGALAPSDVGSDSIRTPATRHHRRHYDAELIGPLQVLTILMVG